MIRPSDQKVIDAFFRHEPYFGYLLSTDGEVLTIKWGPQNIAEWVDGRLIYETEFETKAAELIVKQIRKMMKESSMYRYTNRRIRKTNDRHLVHKKRYGRRMRAGGEFGDVTVRGVTYSVDEEPQPITVYHNYSQPGANFWDFRADGHAPDGREVSIYWSFDLADYDEDEMEKFEQLDNLPWEEADRVVIHDEDEGDIEVW